MPPADAPPPMTVEDVRKGVRAFAEAEGRRPRVLVARIGDDGDDEGVKRVATRFADLGFDVDVGPPAQAAAHAAQAALDNDVHAVVVASRGAGARASVAGLVGALAGLGGADVAVIAAGAIAEAERQGLADDGAFAVIGAGDEAAPAAAALLGYLGVGG